MHSELIDALRESRAYPHATDSIRVIETHISWVLLTGPFAYKIKKPVNLEFLDFTTLEQRHHFCAEELRINRRFADDLYLAVVPISGSVTAPDVDGTGVAFEYAVKMRQFADGALLAEIAAHGSLDPALCRQLGADLAAIHARLPNSRDDDRNRDGIPSTLRNAITQNFRQIRVRLRAADDIGELNRIEDWTWAAYRRLEPLLWTRYQHGLVRECHGDLHLGNLVLIDGRPVPFDAIEFNAEFRWADIANEIAFLLMDCERCGQREAGYIVLNHYLEHSGDYAGLRLLDFFCVYRAMVRAKVALLGETAPVAEDSDAYRNYRHYRECATRHLRQRHCFLAISCGVAGSGKSTLAEQFSARMRAIRIRSDVERKRLFGLNPGDHSRTAGMTDDLYSEDADRRTFARLEELACEIIRAGLPVVVDATFIRAASRADFRALANTLGVDFHILRCDATPAELRRRVAARLHAGSDASEADIAVMERQLLSAELPDPATEPETLVIDTQDSDAVERILGDFSLRSD